MKIAVIGLGYVGAITGACFAKQGNNVVGVDLNTQKVNLINKGVPPIIETSLDQVMKEANVNGSFKATTSYENALEGADIIIVAVGTPVDDNGIPITDYVKNASIQIGKNINKAADYPVIIMRSTIPIGAMETLVKPAIEDSSGKTAGVDFGLGFNPEFLREGVAVKDFFNPPMTVIGVEEEKTAEKLKKLYSFLDAPFIQTSIKNAEVVKLVCNTFHALKICFANEIGNICKQYGIDSHEVMDIVCTDTKLNISKAYLKPGYAFGGSCLPKDTKALTYMGNTNGVNLPLIQAIIPSNNEQVKRAYQIVQETGKKDIAMLGFSFKEGTDDLRESAQLKLGELLLESGYNVTFYDKNVQKALDDEGANKAALQEHLPHIIKLMKSSISETIEGKNLIILGNNDSDFKDVVSNVSEDVTLVDLVRFKKQVSSEKYKGICW